MVKTALLVIETVGLLPVASRCFEQCKGADYIGLYKFTGAADGSVDMAFSGEVHEGIYLMLLEQFGD